MSNYLENNENIVLLNMQRGKRYIGNSSIVLPQSPQKGNTCGLYALNPLRFRFGKNYPAESKERLIELTFSDYRKGLNKIDNETATIYPELLEEIDANGNQQVTKEHIKSALKELRDNLEIANHLSEDTKALRNKLTYFIKICGEFLQIENQNDFEEFLSQKKHQDHIELAKKTINRLSLITNLDAEEVFNNHVKKMTQSVINSHENYSNMLELNLDNPEFMSPLYHQAVINLAASCYQLEGSQWEPSMPIETLMETLRTFGPLVIYTEPCILFDPDECHAIKNTEQYQVYSPISNDEPENDGSHSLLVIGAEKCDGKNFVYLSDPNVPPELTGSVKVYKIPYEELLRKILNVYGVSFQEDADKITGPFAFQAQKGNFANIYNFVSGAQSYPQLANSKKK